MVTNCLVKYLGMDLLFEVLTTSVKKKFHINNV